MELMGRLEFDDNAILDEEIRKNGSCKRSSLEVGRDRWLMLERQRLVLQGQRESSVVHVLRETCTKVTRNLARGAQDSRTDLFHPRRDLMCIFIEVPEARNRYSVADRRTR